MAQISDWSQPEEWIVRKTLKERFGHDPEPQYAAADIRVSPPDRELTSSQVL